MLASVPTPGPTFRRAATDDAEAVLALVASAYRGPQSRQGWTTEADLLDDERIDAAGVLEKITRQDGAVLLAVGVQNSMDTIVGCCEVEHRPGGVAYFGMFAVTPTLQAGGIGRRLLAHAESWAAQQWGSTAMEMTVIAQRAELIAWYERRGYSATGQTRPFPSSVPRDDLSFAVLTKELPGR